MKQKCKIYQIKQREKISFIKVCNILINCIFFLIINHVINNSKKIIFIKNFYRKLINSQKRKVPIQNFIV
jgi:hypothetical protein